MSESVERAVAGFLGDAEIDWEKLKPVMCFVVLWNRLEAKTTHHMTHRRLRDASHRVSRSDGFDIANYDSHIAYFQDRYLQEPERLDFLFWGGGNEVDVESAIRDLLNADTSSENEQTSKTTLTAQQRLEAALMIAWRIRNNLFHGRKDTFQLYAQTDLFTHTNEVLCLFHADLGGGQ